MSTTLNHHLAFTSSHKARTSRSSKKRMEILLLIWIRQTTIQME